MTFQHRAGVSPYTSSFDFAETCVFGKQSLGPFLCGLLGLGPARGLHPTEAPLLPKLRGHFAEFLNEGSSDRLGILYLHTCVGFGTGTSNLPRRFSRRHSFENFGLNGLGIPPRAYGERISLSPALHGYPRTTIAWDPVAFLVPPSVKRTRRGTGISTCWPSTTPFGLALGPD